MKSHILIIGALIAVVSGIITLNIFFQQSLQMDIAQRFNRQQFLLSRSIADNIKSYVLHVQDKLLLISNSLSDAGIRSSRGSRELEEKTRELHDENVAARLGLISLEGRLLFYNGDKDELTPHVQDIMMLAGMIDPGSTRILEVPSAIYLITPVQLHGRPAYAAFFRIQTEVIANIAQNYVTSIGSDTRRYAWMVDRSGNVLFHPTQPAMVGKNIYKEDSTCFTCHVNFDFEKKMLEGRVERFGRYIAPSGTDKIVAFSTIRMDNLSWIVAVSSPYSEVTRPIRRSMKLYSYLIISIFITTSIVSAVLIIFNKNRIKSEEVAQRKEELERYAVQLEDRVAERTFELSSEKEKLNTIVSAIGGGIIMVSKEGRIQWTNQMIRDMAGMDVTGKYCEELFRECNFAATYTGNRVDTIIVSNVFDRKDDYFQITTAPIKGDNGELHGYIKLVQDVTEIKKMQEQIINSEKLASIGRLAAGIAHEIGNPLTSIFSYVQILREMEKGDEFKRESLETISFHINRISEILKQLSGFTRMPSGEYRPSMVNDIIDTALNLIRYDKKAKGISILKELSPDLPEIVIDANQLSQVFINITLNAIDAMPDGGTLTVRSFVREGSIAVQFEDTGIGISEENTNKIFDPFYTTKEKGTGLGLAVSYDILQKMNGTMTVKSKAGEGSTFTILLPVERV